LPLSNVSTLLERYQLKSLLGANGGKQTWLSEDLTTHAKVTVKALYFGHGLEWQDLKLFEREVQTLKNLAHPRIPSYQNSFWLAQPEGNYFCLTQDYIPGISLAEKVRSGWRLEDMEVEQVIISILEVLVYLHNQNPPVIHRDIKPNNLIWGEDNQVYLVDFGAVQAEISAGRTTTVVGTYGYMPPEQFGGRTVPASDLYGLGTTLLFLLTGTNPADLPQEDLKIQFHDRVRIEQPLKKWLEHMVEPSLEDRFQDADEALACLKTRNSLSTSETIDSPSSERLDTLFQLERTPEQLNIEIPGRAFDRSDLLSRSDKVISFGFGMILSLLLSTALATEVRLSVPDPIAFIISLIIFTVLSPTVTILFLLAPLWPILARTRIHLTRDTYEIIWDIKGLSLYRVKGVIQDLTLVEVKHNFKWYKFIDLQGKEISMQGEEESGQKIYLKSKTKQHSLGLGLNLDEQECLVREIEGWLEENRQAGEP
jgi:serine/threonine protein kinase